MLAARNLLVLGLAAIVGAEATWSMPLLSAIGLGVAMVWFWPFVKTHRLYAIANIAIAVLNVALLPNGAVNNIIALTMPFAVTLFWYWARWRTVKPATS
jgi:hypothetical protein